MTMWYWQSARSITIAYITCGGNAFLQQMSQCIVTYVEICYSMALGGSEQCVVIVLQSNHYNMLDL